MPESPINKKSTDSFCVLICAYNEARHIEEVVRLALEQNPCRVIVVDDGSTDRTPELLDSLVEDGVKVLRQSHSGIGAARNRGIKESKGDLIAFLDSDDLWEPRKLEWQIQALKENPEAGIVGGMVQEFFSPDISEDVKRR